MIIHQRIFSKEPISGKALDVHFLRQAVIVVHHAAFTLEAAIDDIEKSYSVSYFESFPFSGGVDFVNISGSFMAQSNGVIAIRLGDCDGHEITETEGRRSHFDEKLVFFWNRHGNLVNDNFLEGLEHVSCGFLLRISICLLDPIVLLSLLP